MNHPPPDNIRLQQLITQIDNLRLLLEEATLRGAHPRIKELLNQIKTTELEIKQYRKEQ